MISIYRLAHPFRPNEISDKLVFGSRVSVANGLSQETAHSLSAVYSSWLFIYFEVVDN